MAGLPAAPEVSGCRCFLPDLTGFTGLRRAGPSHHQGPP